METTSNFLLKFIKILYLEVLYTFILSILYDILYFNFLKFIQYVNVIIFPQVPCSYTASTKLLMLTPVPSVFIVHWRHGMKEVGWCCVWVSMLRSLLWESLWLD